MNTPQAVTERYVSNLLRDGQNADFSILSVTRHDMKVGSTGDFVGFYYSADVMQGHLTGDALMGLGPTPTGAVRTALTKLGVTFR